MKKSQSVVVIGGGVIGLSCAWRLARAGRGVTLLEKGNCGSGASGVPFAALWPSAATKQGAGHHAHRESLWGFETFVRELEASTETKIEFARPGRIELFRSMERRLAAQKEVVAACEQWPAFGDPVQKVLSEDEICSMEQRIAGNPLGGLLCHASAYVDARALVGTLRSACSRLGVALEENREAIDILIQDTRAVGALTFEGPVRADQVLVAAGAWTSTLSPELKSAEIVPVRGQVIVLRPKSPVIAHLMKFGQTYLIPTKGGDVVIGSTAEPNAGFDGSVKQSDRKKLMHAASTIVPALADADVVCEWAGLRPQPVDRTAKIEAVPACKNLFIAAGHYKIGIAMAPWVSRRVVELMGGDADTA